MKKIFMLCLVLIMVFSITGCGNSEDHVGEAKTPSGSSVQKGKDYQSVVDTFEEKGFTNITLEKQADLVTGFLTKEGEVESVSVGGDVNYSPDKWYPNDVEVIITYHTFPDEEKSEDDDSDTTSQEKVDEEILTVDNNSDLSQMLAATDIAIFNSFGEKYKDKTIEFDGCIVYVDNHGDYDTRYDILLSAGDYVDENTANPGPVFKFEDVATYDLGIKDLYLPQFVSPGNNIHVIAEVVEYNAAQDIFELDPVSITKR